MLTWSHYRFQQRLLDKQREFPWCKVIICDEVYTSKTCGNCGKVHPNLGRKKTFHCPFCKVKMDRDANAARNILLRYLTLSQSRNVETCQFYTTRMWDLAPFVYNLLSGWLYDKQLQTPSYSMIRLGMIVVVTMVTYLAVIINMEMLNVITKQVLRLTFSRYFFELSEPWL